MSFARKLFNSTLNSVLFGVTLMVLIALYIAVGSGLVGVREFFEMNDLEFFDTWVLKLLMLLLVLNLSVVTWNRIPLTPPRYGVWCIHSGIIVLIIGTSLYYHLKIEGRTLIPIDRTAFYYYDTAERALYARVPGAETVGMHPLPSLPRFKSYAPELDNGGELQGKDLKGIDRVRPVDVRLLEDRDLSLILGLKNKVTLDVIGFYPYADVEQDVVEDPASSKVGVEIKVSSPPADGKTEGESAAMILTDSDTLTARQSIGPVEFEHRNISQDELNNLELDARQMLEMTISLPGKPTITRFVQLGQTYLVGDGAYNITINSFDPAFTMTTKEVVSTLTVHVQSRDPAPRQEFWRMILQGKTLQTDFKSDPSKTPPFVTGNRQKEPLDKNLQLGFTFNDPGRLMPTEGEKHLLLTCGDKELYDIFTTFFTPAVVRDITGGAQVPFFMDGNMQQAQARRVDHVSTPTRIIETPPAKQDKDMGESGQKQVVLVRVKCGDWSQDVAVPYDPYPAPDPLTGEIFDPWQRGLVHIPGAQATLQLQLGSTCRNLPAQLTLKKLDLTHYPGGHDEVGIMRSIQSVMQLHDRSTGEQSVVVASLNQPVYFDGGRWLFFQAGYDQKGTWSLIGVGNRPGIMIMITGCIMIVLGLMYAFYIKPIVIRRMKSAALARAATMRLASSPRPVIRERVG